MYRCTAVTCFGVVNVCWFRGSHSRWQQLRSESRTLTRFTAVCNKPSSDGQFLNWGPPSNQLLLARKKCLCAQWCCCRGHRVSRLVVDQLFRLNCILFTKNSPNSRVACVRTGVFTSCLSDSARLCTAHGTASSLLAKCYPVAGGQRRGWTGVGRLTLQAMYLLSRSCAR